MEKDEDLPVKGGGEELPIKGEGERREGDVRAREGEKEERSRVFGD